MSEEEKLAKELQKAFPEVFILTSQAPPVTVDAEDIVKWLKEMRSTKNRFCWSGDTTVIYEEEPDAARVVSLNRQATISIYFKMKKGKK